MDHPEQHNGSSDHTEHQSFFHSTYGNFMLFKVWILSDGKATFVSCLILILVAIMFQCLKFIRHRLGRKCANLNCRRYMLNKNHLIQTGLYTVQFITGYLVMLAVMSYNAWVCAAVITGLGLGYFVFGWGEYEDGKRNELLVIRRSTFQCTGKELQELEPLSKEESVDTLLTNMSGGVACSCDNSL